MIKTLLVKSKGFFRKFRKREIGNLSVPIDWFGGELNLKDVKFAISKNENGDGSSSKVPAHTQKEFDFCFQSFLESEKSTLDLFSRKIMGKIRITKNCRKIRVTAVEFQ